MLVGKLNKNKSDSLHLVESSVKNKGSDDGVRTWSTAVQILLPVAALAILWGRKGFFARFFLQFDKNCVSVFCPPFSKRQRLLKWASGRLPPTWSSHANIFPGGPAEFWRDGSLLCTLINSAIPGACPNPHRHWRRPPSHGQALAYKYLGVVPVFTETELSQNGFTLRQEGALVNYLLEVQQAIAKIAFHELKYSSRYAARGMGLVVGEQHRKTAFYIYSSSTTSSSKHDVMVSIRGPYTTYCTATIPAYYISKKNLGNYCEDRNRLAFESKAQRSFLRSLSVDLSSFINVNEKPEIDKDIPIKLISESDRVKVVFIPKDAGIYEISIITNGFHLVGSPFNVNITENTLGAMDSFDENLKYPYTKNKTKGIKRKIISKVVDFIDEKINYESLKIKPLYERSIPKIKITLTKDVSQKNCTEDVNISEDIPNKNQTNVNNFTSSSSLNFEESDLNSTNHEVTNNIFTKIAKEFEIIPPLKSNVTATSEFLYIEPNTTNEFLNQDLEANLKTKSLCNCDEQNKQETDANSNNVITVTLNKSSNAVFNNNTMDVDSGTSSLTKDFLNKPNVSITQSIFTTSPICLEHIEEEVHDESNASSEVPKWNFEKKRPRRQNNVDIFDILDNEREDKMEETLSSSEITINNLIYSELDEQKINKTQKTEKLNLDETMQQSLDTYWEGSDKSTIEHEEIHEPSKITKINKFSVDEVTENLEKEHFRTESQTNLNNMKSESENDNTFSGSNPLNILSFLSSLKIENENFENLTTLPTVTLKTQPEVAYLSNLDQEEFKHRSNFKQRLEYWESQTDLDISQRSRKLRLRRSLPSLLPCSGSELFLFVAPNKENLNYKFQDNSEAMEFKSQFKERQDYWKALSSQSIDYSSITSSMYYLETLGKINEHRIKARRSLPDLFSKVSRAEILNEMSYRNFCFPSDFFDSPEAVNFKTKFKECREFWERLSTQNLDFKSSYEYIDANSFKQEHFDDSNFDSGFYNSLPNLSSKQQNWDISDSFDEYSDSLKFKRQFEERREYWEKLSLHSVSDLSLSSLLDSNKLSADAVTVKISSEIQQKKIQIPNKCRQETRTNLNNGNQSILHNECSLKDKEATNLTDDLKHINDRREKMKMHYNQAKSFFKNLEETIK